MNESNTLASTSGLPARHTPAIHRLLTEATPFTQGRGKPPLGLVVPGNGIEVDVVSGQASGGPGLAAPDVRGGW